MIVVDVETTGPIPRKHAIVSIGAVDFSEPKNQFYGECRIADDVVIDPMALKVNGFSRAQLKDPEKPTLSELIIKFNAWIEPIPDKTLGGHNTSFDINMLWAAYHKADIHAPFGVRHIDLHSLVYTHMLKTKHPIPLMKDRTAITSDTVANYVGLPDEPRPHQALNGAKHEAEALSRIIYGQNLFSEYKKYSIPEYLR